MTQILLIDDDPTTRLVLKRALQRQGYDIIVANDGEQGLEIAQSIKPGLIICDWMMPGTDGLEVCRQIKRSSNLSTTFFILLTARGGLEDRIVGLDTGADEFLSKPIDIGELLARVRAGLRITELSRDLQLQTQHLRKELSEASDYVQTLLPPPFAYDRLSIETCFIPSAQLGGDCYDFLWLDNDHLAIYLIDASGHGVGSALLSISVFNLLHARLLPDSNFAQPHTVLEALNTVFQTKVQDRFSAANTFFNEKYFTIWYGVYSVPTRQLTYSSAGHPPAQLITSDLKDKNSSQPQPLGDPSLPIGLFPDITYTSRSVILPPDSVIYLFSDGIYDFLTVDGKAWGLESFGSLLAEDPSCQRSLAEIVQLASQYNRIATFDDDLSLLRIQIEPNNF
ncbi:MAG: response regulator [Oscillatoriales cyanobacterium]|nr:MAG: response regulator [Oscillatoriales cyanobacterium]